VIRVVIADDHAVVRAGVRAVLAAEADLHVVAEADSPTAVMRELKDHAADTLLVDLTMPGGRGVDLIARVRQAFPNLRILVLSMHATPEYVSGALAAGANGYVVKGSGLEDLVTALRAVAAGKSFLDASAKRVAGQPGSGGSGVTELARLSLREREVLILVAEGHTNREISELLVISPKTVDTHRTSLMRKLDLHDAQALTRFAMQNGLLSGV